MMEFMGMTMNDLNRPSADVWPEHARILEILTLNPWRYHGMGSALGMDWVQIASMCQLLGIPEEERRQLVLDLHTVEQAALPLLNA